MKSGMKLIRTVRPHMQVTYFIIELTYFAIQQVILNPLCWPMYSTWIEERTMKCLLLSSLGNSKRKNNITDWDYFPSELKIWRREGGGENFLDPVVEISSL